MFSEIKQFSEKLESLKCGSGSCIKSAMYHIEKAEILSEVDPEMAIFRLITAEEEAATAILLMLKEHGYEGARELNKNNHLHKQCLYPYLCAIMELLKSHLEKVSDFPPVLDWVDVDGMDGIKLGIRLTIEEQRLIMEMNPPLNFRVSHNEELHDFSNEMVLFLERKGFNDTVKHLKDSANLRNKLLYSDGSKIPNTLADTENGKFERLAKFLLQKVNALIVIYFMTSPYKKMEKAHFLEQALHSYLKVLKYVRGQRL